MKKMPTITIKHSSKMKVNDLNSNNKRMQKLRESLLKMRQSQEQVDEMFPDAVLETFINKPGFYGKFSGPRGGEWRGPFLTEDEARNVVGEIAFESTYS